MPRETFAHNRPGVTSHTPKRRRPGCQTCSSPSVVAPFYSPVENLPSTCGGAASTRRRGTPDKHSAGPVKRTTVHAPPNQAGEHIDTDASTIAEFLDPLSTLIQQAPGLTLAWITFCGGCIGSFINVVVYRLPAGMSLVHPGSQCPACGHAIRWYDNLPLIGWLRLRGRCRDCQSKISPRYPLVELLVMAIFAQQWLHDVPPAVELNELGSGVFAFAWHASLLCTLVCAALIDFDGHAIPGSLIRCGAILPLLLGLLSPQAVAPPIPTAGTSLWGTMIAGAFLAALITWLLRVAVSWPRIRQARSNSSPRHRDWASVGLSAMSGLYLGPERAGATLLLATLLWWLLRLVNTRPTGVAPWSWFLAASCWVAVAF